ncbi:MAG: hypothetical protein Q8L14_36675, partial [Myxococcales bacterium]|nr:hypothetical protein [Myxococcales bacterium]
MNARVLVTSLAAAMLAVGCSPPGSGPNPAGTGKAEAKAIGAAGGTIELEKVKLIVAPNTVPSDVMFSVTSSPNAAAANYTAHTPIYVFKPENTDFQTPVTVEFDITGRTVTNPVVYWTRKGSAVFERQPSTVNGSKVSAQVNHFSMGFVGEASSRLPDGGTV